MGVGAEGEAIREVGDGAYAMLPRPFQWVLAFPRSPLWLGAASGLAYLLLSAIGVAAGLFEDLTRENRSYWLDAGMMELSYALWFAWIPVAVAYLVRGLERDALDLAPLLGAEGASREALRAEALRVGAGPIWGGAAVGLALTGGAVWFILSGSMVVGGRLPISAGVWAFAREIASNLAVMCTLGWGVGAALRLGRLVRERARVDLLDLGALSPLARNGTRLAFFALVMVACGIPGLLLPPQTLGPSAYAAGVISMLVLALLAVALLAVPTSGARAAVRAAKAAELERVRGQLEEARRTRQDERLPGLLEWERRLGSISEWPIDTHSLGRIGLYLLIPLGSWVGSALVERLVDDALR